MDFGKAMPYKAAPTVKDRSFIGDIGGAISGAAGAIGGALTGSIDTSKSVTFHVAAGTPNTKTNIFTDPDLK